MNSLPGPKLYFSCIFLALPCVSDFFGLLLAAAAFHCGCVRNVCNFTPSRACALHLHITLLLASQINGSQTFAPLYSVVSSSAPFLM